MSTTSTPESADAASSSPEEGPSEWAPASHYVHVMLQGKGGAGKSYVAITLAQWLRTRGSTVGCYDADPVNHTFGQYQSLDVRKVDLMVENTVNQQRFDAMVQQICTEDGSAVVDTGASSFAPFTAYLLENEIPDLFASAGRQMVAHVLVSGGPPLTATLNGLDLLLRYLPRSVPIVLWINEFFGAAEINGKHFTDGDYYRRHEHRFRSVIRLPHRNRDTFGATINTMLTRSLTFDEAIQDAGFDLVAKQRLAMTRRDSYQLLDAALPFALV